MTSLLTREESDALRDACMSSVHAHAESDWAEWGDLASAFLTRYAREHVEFTAEEVTNASLADEAFPQPRDLRAWGSTFRVAIRHGVVEVAGTGRSLRRHSSICLRYRSRIYG